MINCLGDSPDRIWTRLLAGDRSGLAPTSDWVPGREIFAGRVDAQLPRIPASLSRFTGRNNALTLAALAQIESTIQAFRADRPDARIGVVMGTTTGGVLELERTFASYSADALPDTFHYDALEFGATASFVAEVLGVTGPAYTLSTACSSGARALASARELLALGVCDAVVAGATDSLCGLTTNGFAALQALAAGVSKPCSADRDGINLGEGSAVFWLTAESGGIQLAGVGESSEAHHISAPDPTGGGAIRAMRGSLHDAGIGPDQIAYLNLHGTGTPQNDSMECTAVAEVFPGSVPCSSTKALVGHTLGAAGAMEAGFCWLALDRREGSSIALPPHRYDGAYDPALPRVALTSVGDRAEAPPEAWVMTNSFGFGGNNCTLVLRSSA